MITHLLSVGLYVRDQDAALDFYVNKLGFEKRADRPMGTGFRWIEVAPPGAQTVIVLATQDYAVGLSDKIGAFTDIVLTTDDIQATCEELRKRGVEFTQPPAMQSYGKWHAAFKDPDGNEFFLTETSS